MSAFARFGLVKLRECGLLLYEKRFSLRLVGAVYKSHVCPGILYGSDV